MSNSQTKLRKSGAPSLQRVTTVYRTSSARQTTRLNYMDASCAELVSKAKTKNNVGKNTRWKHAKSHQVSLTWQIPAVAWLAIFLHKPSCSTTHHRHWMTTSHWTRAQQLLRWATVWPQQTWVENWGAAVPLSVGRAGFPPNTMSPGLRPTSVPSGILIHPAVWPQYINDTDRTDSETDSTTVP